MIYEITLTKKKIAFKAKIKSLCKLRKRTQMKIFSNINNWSIFAVISANRTDDT